MLRPLLLGLALAGAVSACASKASTPAPAGPAALAQTKASPRSTRDLIVGNDLVATGLDNVYACLNRLRPTFLNTIRAAPRVLVDDAPRSMDELKSMPPAQIDYVRYFDAVEAEGRFGGAAPMIYIVPRGHTPRVPLPR